MTKVRDFLHCTLFVTRFTPCFHGCFQKETKKSDILFGNFNMSLQRRQRERSKKQWVKISKKTTWYLQPSFLYISLPSLHDYHVKLPHFTFYSWGHFNSEEKLKTMLMQNFGVTNREHYGIRVCYGIFWSGQFLFRRVRLHH